jgi:iron(III) transport system permease protein
MTVQRTADEDAPVAAQSSDTAGEGSSRSAVLGRPRAVLRAAILRPGIMVALPVGLIVAYFALVPLVYLVWGTFFDASGFTLEGFTRAYSHPATNQMIANSLVYALGSGALALVLGTALAYLHTRTDVPFKGLFFAAAMVPLIIPAILYAIAWIFLAGGEIGILNLALRPVFGRDVLDVFSMPGMIWVEGLNLSPLVFLLMVVAFRGMDPSLEESALMSGASRGLILRRITLPLAKPAIAASLLIMVVRGLESFEVPALLGLQNGIHVFTSRIYLSLRDYPPDLAAAGALSTGLLAIAIVGVLLSSRFGGSMRQRAHQTITGKGFQPRRVSLGRAKPLFGAAVVLYFGVTVVLPMAVLLWTSLLAFYQAPSTDAVAGLTLDNYRQLLRQDAALDALKNSSLLGAGAATLVVVVMAVAAWVVVRTDVPGRHLIDQLSFLPLVVPGLVLGLAVAFVYLRSPVPIYGTLWILLIAYFIRAMPYGMRYALVSIQQISRELEESAQVSGAGWGQTFRRVLLPLMAPGLIAVWVYVFITSFRELSSSILLYSPGNEVLSILIWDQYENGDFTVLAALGVVMLLLTVAVVVLAHRLTGKSGVGQV